MRDRIVFFILGAVLATVAYFAGDMDKAGAQGDLEFIDKNVLISGDLIVAGGLISVINEPHLKMPDQIEGSVNIMAGSEGGSIKIFNGTPDSTGTYPSNILITAHTKDDGDHVSAVILHSEYKINTSAMWGRKERNKYLFEELK